MSGLAMRSAFVLVALLLAACAATVAPSASPGTALEAALPPLVADVQREPSGPERVAGPSFDSRPAPPILAARFEAALIADYCVDRDVAAPSSADVVLTVLDRTYALPPAYVPHDLVPASTAGLAGISGTKLVRSILIDDLAAMRAAWEAAGLDVTVESGYRSYAAQAATFESWASRLGFGEALLRSARPGHSEHQLGTAIDVTSRGWGGRFGDWAVETAEGSWMAAHAWEYGFVMSYPAGSQADTCFGYEPWHYRWIGREAAAAHRESGEHLRPFLARYAGG